MRRDYSDWIPPAAQGVSAQDFSAVHRRRDGGTPRVPAVDLPVRTRVVRGVAADMYIVESTANVLFRQGRRAILVWMRVPFPEHLGSLGNSFRGGHGIHRAAIRSVAHIAPGDGALELTVHSVDEGEVFIVEGPGAVDLHLSEDVVHDCR